MKSYGDRILADNLLNKKTAQLIKPQKSFILKALQVKFIGFNSPDFTGLRAEIFSVSNNEPFESIGRSINSYNSNQLNTSPNWISQIYFEFSKSPGIHLSKDETYAVVFFADSYLPNDDSHLAIAKGWPDHIYRTNLVVTRENLNISPYFIGFIGLVL